MRYVALLRGINVGGHNIIRMEELRRIFADLGLESVSTHLQSGNVLFEAEDNTQNLLGRIESVLPGGNIKVCLRNSLEMDELVNSCPFDERHPEPKHSFVTFLREASDLPLTVTTPGAELLLRTRKELLWYYTPVEGKFQYPNFEKQLKVAATTRNWNVVQKLRELLAL